MHEFIVRLPTQTRIRARTLFAIALIGLCYFSSCVSAASLPECIAPARPGGGFDVTCDLVRSGLRVTQAGLEPPHTSYMPGGVGAVTFNAFNTDRSAEPNTLVAFSGGSLFNIAQGRFGRYSERDVRWVATLGVDYGVLIVKADSIFKSLPDLVAALKKRPEGVTFGGSGTVGSQDWTKVSLVAQAADVSFKRVRFVGFEGGGDANAALLGNHVDVVSGDASEAIGLIHGGAKLRILTVFSEHRLPGLLRAVPTARETGQDIVWPNMRGVYMGPHVKDADYARWVEIFNRMLNHPAYPAMLEQRGLQPLSKTGAELDELVMETVDRYRKLTTQSGLVVKFR
jgi:putative tricarboxylic transport membrane protein